MRLKARALDERRRLEHLPESSAELGSFVHGAIALRLFDSCAELTEHQLVPSELPGQRPQRSVIQLQRQSRGQAELHAKLIEGVAILLFVGQLEVHGRGM